MSEYKSKVVKATKWNKKNDFKHTVAGFYGKPLVRAFDDLRLERAFRLLSRDVMRRVRANVLQTTFSDAAKKRLTKAVRVKLGPSSLRLVVKDPLWRYLLGGRKAQEMKWLRKAKKPIPIVTETGKLIFRSGQPGVVKSGPREGSTPRWYHPGRGPIDVLSRAKEESRKSIRVKLGKEIARQVQTRIG